MPTVGEPRRQVKFECSEKFHKKLMDEKIERNLTLQQLAVRALERYLAVPESAHRELDEAVKRYGFDIQKALKESLVAIRRIVEGTRPEIQQQDPEEAEREELAFAIGALVRHFPLDKARLTRELLTLDARHYQSARIKPPKRNRGDAARKSKGE